jgi:chemotaxis protein CheD
MVHILLPSTQKYQEQSLGPCYFAITGVPLMINSMCSDYGCQKGELIVRLFGGADSIRDNDVFWLGKRNIKAVVKVLTEMNLTFDVSETGGLISRTLEMNVANGRVLIKSQDITI